MSTLISYPSNLSKEFVMAQFIQPEFSPSAAYSVGGSVSPRAARRSAESTKALAGMLLAAAMAALLVVADQLIDTWADGHLLMAWVALWTVAFAGLAFLAPPLRQLSSALAGTLARWSQAAQARRMEEKMWEYARHDPRIMAELQHAWMRDAS
jgi:hypothetical protein